MKSILFIIIIFFSFLSGALADSDFPLSANNSYLMTPLSYETSQRINQIKQDIGDAPSRGEKDSYIKNIKQQTSISKDGIIDLNEDIEFSVYKKANADNNILFTRKYPLSRVNRRSGQSMPLSYDIMGMWGTDIDISSEKSSDYLIVTVKSNEKTYKAGKIISGTAHINLQLIGAISEVTFDDEYSSLIASDDFSLPVDDIFVTVEVPDTIILRSVRSEVSSFDEIKENMARIVNNKAGFKTLDKLKKGQVFRIDAWFSKGITIKKPEPLQKGSASAKSSS